MFFKTRMRRLLRRMIAAAAPDGLRPDRRMTHARAVMFERAAAAFGLTRFGMSPAQAALSIIHAARAVAGRFAVRWGLLEFSAAIARMERLAALPRQGHPSAARPGIAGWRP